MRREKDFSDFLFLKGELPGHVIEEARELYYMGLRMSEIDQAIRRRTES